MVEATTNPDVSVVVPVRNEAGKTGFRILVGGGQGRTPMIGYAIREFLPAAELLNYFMRSCASTTVTAVATTCTRRGSRFWSRS